MLPWFPVCQSITGTQTGSSKPADKVTGSALNPSGIGKRFKQIFLESELNAHLLSHNKKELQCDECPYKNSDVRNLRAHKRRHSELLFLLSVHSVVKGSNGSNNVSRHLKSGTCPEQNKK